MYLSPNGEIPASRPGAVGPITSGGLAIFDNVVMRVASFATSLGAGASGYVKTQIHGPWKERRSKIVEQSQDLTDRHGSFSRLRLRDVGRGVGWCGQARKGVWGMSWRQEAQGRGRLRKVPGSRQTGFDPETPEPTRGTETSQYPEEEKEKSTPSVAASERGRAQTGGVTLRGSRTAFRIQAHSGTAWNRRPQRVKAPYATWAWTERDPEYDSTRESESESAGTIPQG